MQHFRSVSRIVHNRLLCGASILLFAGAMLNAQANSNTSAVAKQHPDWVQSSRKTDPPGLRTRNSERRKRHDLRGREGHR